MQALIFDRPYRIQIRRLPAARPQRIRDTARAATRIEQQTGLTRPEALELAERIIQTN